MVKNGWDEYKKLILHELEENTLTLKEVSKAISDIKSDVSALKVKAAVAGGIAGMVGTGLVTAILTVFK